MIGFVWWVWMGLDGIEWASMGSVGLDALDWIDADGGMRVEKMRFDGIGCVWMRRDVNGV